VLVLLRRGLKNRAIRSTEFNQESSRGHTILQLNIEVEEEDDSSGEGLRVLKRSTLSLVDLAGSEKSSISTSMSLSGSMNSNVYASQMAAEAQQKEMNNINTSLHVLGNCVSALIEPNRKHIPYRNSVLYAVQEMDMGLSNILPARYSSEDTPLTGSSLGLMGVKRVVSPNGPASVMLPKPSAAA
jgi:kinesin family protein 5